MKSLTFWSIPNTGATNESGFTALPGGHIFNPGQDTYQYVGLRGYYWSSDYKYFVLKSDSANVSNAKSASANWDFGSIRLVKD